MGSNGGCHPGWFPREYNYGGNTVLFLYKQANRISFMKHDLRRVMKYRSRNLDPKDIAMGTSQTTTQFKIGILCSSFTLAVL